MRIDKKFIINDLTEISSDLDSRVNIIVGREMPKEIKYGYYDSLFGEMIIGLIGSNICWIGFSVDKDGDQGVDRMFARFPNVLFVKDNIGICKVGDAVIKSLDRISLILFGSDFQIEVWRSLLKIDKGFVTSYGVIAKWLGKEKASRAIGNAVGANPVSLLIPCHRVIQANGNVNNYLWGNEKKIEILKSEIKDISH